MKNYKRMALILAVTVVGLGWLAADAGAQVESVLYSFKNAGDGAHPVRALIMDSSGNLYGTTNGENTPPNCGDCGTVFELVKSSGTYTEKTLYSFTGTNGDGANPNAALMMDSSGNLYGTTFQGGAFPDCGEYQQGCGTVFELVNNAGTYTEKVLYSFMSSGGDGANPNAGLIMDTAGNLYGTTTVGGAFNGCLNGGCGTVFELVNSGGTYTEKVLYSFNNSGGDAQNPYAGLSMDPSGNLYGTTQFGGTSSNCRGNCGAVFELVNSSGSYTEKVLYSFTASGGDGSYPTDPPLIDASGNLYGTTQNGGISSNCPTGQGYGCGTVFELVNSSGSYTEKVLYAFTGTGGDGAQPEDSLITDGSGNLYGTAYAGGIYTGCQQGFGCGTVFELVNSAGSYAEKTLYSFTGSNGDGENPQGTLVMDTSGNLYGTNVYGGAGYGTVFEVSPCTTTTTLASSANPATAGDLINLTATVASACGVPTGSVQFFNGATSLGTMTLTNGTATLAIEDADSLGIGTFMLMAQYNPTGSFSASSGTLNQTVNEPGVALTSAGNTFAGNQTINGSLSATSLSGNGSGLTGVTAAGLNCPGCVGNSQLGINYALGDSQGGSAMNALALGGNPASFFAAAAGDPNYAPASGSGSYVAKTGDTMTGTLNLPANGLVAGGSQFVLSGGRVGIGTASPITPFDSRRNGSALPNGSIASDGNAVGYFENNGNATNVWVNVKPTINGGTDENYYFALNGNYVGGLRYNVTGDYVALFHNDNNSNDVNHESFVLKSGNVGIGTQTPQATLEVNGTAQFDSTVTFAAGQTFAGNGSGLNNLNPANISAGTANINITGSAATATSAVTATTAGSATVAGALAATPSQCGANNFATGVAASGNANCLQPASTNLSDSSSLVRQTQILFSSAGVSVSNDAFVGVAGTSTTEAKEKQIVAVGGAIAAMQCFIGSASTVSTSFTVRLNSVGTAAVCTIGTGATKGSATGLSVPFAAGDLLDVQVKGATTTKPVSVALAVSP